MSKIINYFTKISDMLDRITGYFCIGFGMIMTLTTLVGILFRYIMTNPLPWTEELARYAMIWMGLLAISMGVKRDNHLGLELIINHFPSNLRKMIKLLTRIIIGVFLYILMVYGYQAALKGLHQTAPALQISMIYILIAVPVAALLALCQLILVTIIDAGQVVRRMIESENLWKGEGKECRL